MPEGLESAARAFQTEIAPASERPRDQTGRFVATDSRPEPMFQPRPIEGDPATGDTRDGGDDARLAEIERRIADGRAEEGDAEFAAQSRRQAARQARARGERLPADDEGARHASADDRHQRAQAEQGGPQEPGQSDQDAEGADGRAQAEAAEGDAEGLAERDAAAESQFKITTLDGQPVEKFEVSVDGQPVEVSLNEALQGYINEATFRQRMTKVVEARNVIEQEASQLGQAREAYVQRLAFADRMLSELTPAPPDWDKEFASDPRQAHEKQKAYGAIYGKRQQIAQEIAQVQAEAQADYDRRARDYAINGFSRFVQEANIPDERALNTELSRMRSYGKSVGFNEGELATVYDPRMLRVLRDAARYHSIAAARPKAVSPGRGKTLTPGAAAPIGGGVRKGIDEAQQRLARTGRLDDAQAVFERLIR